MSIENDSSDLVADILERFQTLINENLNEDEIEARIKTDFTEEEQKIISETFLSLLESEETERHFPLNG